MVAASLTAHAGVCSALGDRGRMGNVASRGGRAVTSRVAASARASAAPRRWHPAAVASDGNARAPRVVARRDARLPAALTARPGGFVRGFAAADRGGRVVAAAAGGDDDDDAALSPAELAELDAEAAAFASSWASELSAAAWEEMDESAVRRRRHPLTIVLGCSMHDPVRVPVPARAHPSAPRPATKDPNPPLHSRRRHRVLTRARREHGACPVSKT